MYNDASLHIKPKDRIGLIGPNGAGKSTLLRLLSGEYQPDGGSISKGKDCTVGFLNQDLMSFLSEESILNVAMQAFGEAVAIEAEIEEILQKMETDYTDDLVEKLANLQEEFERLDGYNMRNLTSEILEGLGFSTADLERPLREFSGGWRMRVMLAKLLLQKPSLLMLDEPTNHMDLPSIQWIEQYLSNYEGALIIVSHDRQFLDNIVNTIVEVNGGKLVPYSGNYSFYMEEKALRQEIQKGAYENQQAQIKQAERFIERFRSKASKATLVQSRIKALERLDIIDDVIDETARVNFKFNFSNHPGKTIVALDSISKAYGDKVILKNSTSVIERGDKIALIGANGKGKSTLLRIISDDEEIEGERTFGHNVSASFFAQHQLESLNINNTLLEELQQTGTSKTEMELRSILGCFLFSGEDAFKKIKVLSGGEKSRVALAKTLISHANFLMLDEPTNHLDIQSVNILIQALQQYEGTYIAISHDRHFLSHIANKIWYIEDYQIKEFPGTYNEYERFIEENKANNKNEPIKLTSSKNLHKSNAATVATTVDSSKEIAKLKKRVDVLEKEITALEKQKAEIENELSKVEIYSNPTKFEAENNKFIAVTKQLDELQTEWENAIITLEA
ncbi:MAG: hypothetical protein RLZZ175_19 [Bacteroidota bacterium]|jgi:ATP-binding cassette subfamily F protein 3